MALTDLSKLSKHEYTKFLNSFDTVLTDCDGVLWLADEVIRGAPLVMKKFKDLGKQVFYVTNNSTKTRYEFIDKFKLLGFDVCQEEIVSTAFLTANYLSSINFKKKVYIVGSYGLAKELNNVGIRHIGVGPDPMVTNIKALLAGVKGDPEVGAVVVGFDEHFSYPKMVKAATYLERKGTLFLATNTDERFPHGSDTIMPGTGSFVKAIETCAERPPKIIGKPESYIRDYLVNKHNINPSRTLMIGDRCNSDILMGNRCGFHTLLVLSGVTSLEQVKTWKASSDKTLNELVPGCYTNSIADLLIYLS